jgi:hypothetical protein
MARRRENAYYDPISIEVLESYEAIRRRPGLYLGEVQSTATKTRLLMHCVCVAADAAVRGRPVKLRVSLEEEGATIEDDGPGIPIEEDRGRWLPEKLMSLICGCAGMRHVEWIEPIFCVPGIAVTTALSRTLELDTWNRGRSYHQRFDRGRPTPPRIGSNSEHGLRIRFALDPVIFHDATLDADDVKRAVTELAFLVPELEVQLDHRGQRTSLERIDLPPLTPDQTNLSLRALAIDLDVLRLELGETPIPNDSPDPTLAIRRVAVALTALDRDASTAFRQNAARMLQHVAGGRITSLAPYRELWERLVAETSERVMLADLLACGSPEDAAVEIDLRLDALL